MWMTIVFAFIAAMASPSAALSPGPEVRCCSGRSDPQCAQYDLSPERCKAILDSFDRMSREWHAKIDAAYGPPWWEHFTFRGLVRRFGGGTVLLGIVFLGPLVPILLIRAARRLMRSG